MHVPRHNQIKPGTIVSIVLKADQRTGRQVQGTVQQLLTRGDHPRGVKVRLADGRIGRVQQLVSQSAQTGAGNQNSTLRNVHKQARTSNMSSDQNPWQTIPSQGNPYVSNSSTSITDNNPYHQSQPREQQSQYAADSNPWSQQQQQPQSRSHQYSAPEGPPPGHRPLRRSSTAELPQAQEDRAEQVEHMQNFEAQARETEDDRNQAQLRREFPNIDSSLIAAIYNDTKNMPEVREMLQELAST